MVADSGGRTATGAFAAAAQAAGSRIRCVGTSAAAVVELAERLLPLRPEI